MFCFAELQCTLVLRNFIAKTMTNWAQQDIKDPCLTREVFSLLHRQYDGVGEVYRGLTKAYVVKDTGAGEIVSLMKAQGNVLSLLRVRMGPTEEEILRVGLRYALSVTVPPSLPFQLPICSLLQRHFFECLVLSAS